MTDREKLTGMLQEATRLAERLGEQVAAYIIRNALMELHRHDLATPAPEKL